MKKWPVIFLGVLLTLFCIACLLVYFFQEKLLFFPTKLSRQYQFPFKQPVEEGWLKDQQGNALNAVLFDVPHARGVIYYLHGNAGSIDNWGSVAPLYNALGYAVFLLDYPGYGKSEGAIQSEQQLFSAAEAGYAYLATRYAEKDIVILGYSIGSGPACWLSARHNQRLLILQAPYYSMKDLLRKKAPLLPAFLLRYPLESHLYLAQCKSPVVIYHGEEDNLIYPGSSQKLAELFKPGDELVLLHQQGHNGITDNLQYQQHLRGLLR